MTFISPGSVPGVAGLGITFLPSPPLPLPPPPPANNRQEQQRVTNKNREVLGPELYYPHPQRSRESIRHSISYDSGMNQNYQQQNQEMMYRNDSVSSKGGSSYKGGASMTSSKISQNFDRRSESRGSYQGQQQPQQHGSSTLSPFTSDDGSGSSSHSFSPPSASLSSAPPSSHIDSYRPSSHNPLPPFPVPPNREVKHSQSMSTLPTVFRGLGFSTHSIPYPLSPTPYLSPHSTSVLSPIDSHSPLPTPPPISSIENVNRSPSRLPAFLIERHRKEQALTRPKSMMELGQMYALDAIRDVEEPEEEEEEEGEEDDEEEEEVEDEYFTSGNGVEVEMRNEEDDQYADAVSSTECHKSTRQSLASSSTGEEEDDDDTPLRHKPSLHRLFSSRGRSLSTGDAELLPSELAKLRLYASMNNLRAQSESIQPQASKSLLVEEEGIREVVIEDEQGSPLPILASRGVELTSSLPSLSKILPPSTASSLPSPTTRTTANRSTSVVQQEPEKLGKARVELELKLENSIVVEGGHVKGSVEVRMRKSKEKESQVWIGNPKIRVVGFEELDSQDDRNVFYHHATSLSDFTTSNELACFDSEADNEGYRKGLTGNHILPFNLLLPIGKGAKGSCKTKQGVIRYIVIASMKLKSQYGNDRSIAHFYRHIEIFPYFDPSTTLRSAIEPLKSTASKAIFMGGSGKVILSAEMHRGIWVAGQKCYVKVGIENLSSKKMKTLSISLVRSTTIMEAGTLNNGPQTPDVDRQISRKKMAESSLDLAKKGSTNSNAGVDGEGIWLGVEAGVKMDLTHFLEIPSDTLTITKGNHLEISYIIRVSVGGTSSSEVTTDIPVTFINFISIDPPPGHTGISTVSSGVSITTTPITTTQLVDFEHETSSYQKGHTTVNSVDSICLSELNPSTSPDSQSLATLSSIAVISPTTSFGLGARNQLNHQMSLDCIANAISSATARNVRQVNTSGSSKLQMELRLMDSDETESLSNYYGGGGSNSGGNYEKNNENHTQLDDLDEIPDDEGDEGSDDRHYYESPVEEPSLTTTTKPTIFSLKDSAPISVLQPLSQSSQRARSPLPIQRRPTSPLKITAMPPPPLPPKVVSKQRSFAFATPSSPIRATVPKSRNPSPIRPTTRLVSSSSPFSRVPSRSLPPPPPFGSSRPILSTRNSSSSIESVTSNTTKEGRIVKKDSAMNLKRTAAVIAKKPSARTLRPALSPSSPSFSPPDLDFSSDRSTPDLDHTMTPPSHMSPRTTQRPPFNSNPRAMMTSPSLYSSRSVGDLRKQTLPTLPTTLKRNVVLPAVQKKVSILESRQVALMRLAKLAVDGPDYDGPLIRSHSIANSEASFKLSDLTRANSVESFKAPMLRK